MFSLALLALLLAAPSLPAQTAAQLPVPAPPEVPARGYLLLDFVSGNVLAERNADQPLEPASITKIMSAYITYGRLAGNAIGLHDEVPISENAYRQEGSRMFVELNSRVSLHDLLLGVVVQSGNDATVAMAEYVAGSESVFAELMNRQAEALGMGDTHFVNSTGLPHPEHVTTARDIATLVRALIRHYPEHYRTYAVRKFSYNGIEQANRNKLLWRDPSIDGVKTGHTSSAGYCLVASAERDGIRLISVVLGAETEEDRLVSSQQLLDYGFRFFETFKLYNSGQMLTEVDLWKGETDTLKLGFAEDVFVTIPRGRYQDLQASLETAGVIQAPVAQGQPFGRVLIELEGRQIATPTLVALEDVGEGGTLSRLADHLVLLFRSWTD